MAIAAATVFQVQKTATAANANGAGFNPANANFITDGVIGSGTGNSPTLTSATYSFVAGDVGAWIWLPVQTNITVAGFFQIASVSSGVATLSAAIGQGILVTPSSIYTASLVAGVSASASFSSVKYGVDYSQSDTAPYTATTLTGATTTCTDATNPFTAQMVGNLWHLNSGTGLTAGWYEIVSVSAGTATLDRSAGTTFSAVTYHGGGAASLGSSTTNQTDVLFLALGAASTTAGNIFFIKGGTNISYTIPQAVTTVVGNAAWHSRCEGYAVTRGDRPTDATRPTFNVGTNTFTQGSTSDLISIIFTGSAASAVITGTQTRLTYVKATNTSTTAAQVAIRMSGQASKALFCEGVCYRGVGLEISSNSGQSIFGCYLHDSDIGFENTSGTSFGIQNCIIACNVTAAIFGTAGNNFGSQIFNNTLYGSENKLGTGMSWATGNLQISFLNNIIYGFATGVSHADTNTDNYDDYNCYSNNTSDVSSAAQWQKGLHDIAVNPSFTAVSQVTGTTATSSGSVLTVSGGGVGSLVPGQDYLYIKSGTGVTAGIYGITAVTGTTITTDIALGTSVAGNIVWQVTTGRNWAVGTNLKGVGYPGIVYGSNTTGFMDIGAIPRQEAGGGGGQTSYAYSG